MIVGFTGTRRGMTREQRASVVYLLGETKQQFAPVGVEFWHGDEAHADTEAAGIAQDLGYLTVAWPGPDPATRGSHVSDVTRPPRAYLARNRVIACGCDLLIATPDGEEERRRSGTWATVRYAREAGKPVKVVGRDGWVV